MSSLAKTTETCFDHLARMIENDQPKTRLVAYIRVAKKRIENAKAKAPILRSLPDTVYRYLVRAIAYIDSTCGVSIQGDRRDRKHVQGRRVFYHIAGHFGVTNAEMAAFANVHQSAVAQALDKIDNGDRGLASQIMKMLDAASRGESE